MGPPRYDVAGAEVVLSRPAWDSSISFLPIAEPSRTIVTLEGQDPAAAPLTDNLRGTSPRKYSLLPHEISHPTTSTGIPSSWTTISGRFWCVNIANISCKCIKAPKGAFPQANIDDGKLQIVLIAKTNVIKFVHHLTHIARGTGNQFRFGFIQCFETTEFVASNADGKGCWNIDGELVVCAELRGKILPHAVSLFGNSELDGDASARVPAGVC
jgi:hypothetical protein